MRDRQAVLITVNTSKSSKSVFLPEIASAMDPKIGLEITEINAPSARKIDVNRCVKDGSRPIRCSRTVGNNGSMNANRSSSEGIYSLLSARFPRCSDIVRWLLTRENRKAHCTDNEAIRRSPGMAPWRAVLYTRSHHITRLLVGSRVEAHINPGWKSIWKSDVNLLVNFHSFQGTGVRVGAVQQC